MRAIFTPPRKVEITITKPVILVQINNKI